MPQIDHATLMDRMMVLLTNAAPGDTVTSADLEETAHSLLTAPMAALNEAPRGFDQVYGETGALLTTQADLAELDGAPELARLLRALQDQLHDGTLELQNPPTPAQRLTGFVYPVI